MNKKKIGLAVLALIALLATVSAAVWLLTVKVPVVYKDPLEIWFSDETTSEWYPLELGKEHILPAVNLTYRTFETYNNATNNAKRDVRLTVNITAYNKTDESITDLIGFEIDGRKYWGTVEFSSVVPAGETVSKTVTYILSWDAPSFDTASPDFEIVWQLFRSEP